MQPHLISTKSTLKKLIIENFAIKRVQSQVYLSYAEREHNRRRQ